jgi:hypothetical protein
MTSLVLGDLVLESLTPSVNAPLECLSLICAFASDCVPPTIGKIIDNLTRSGHGVNQSPKMSN